MANRLEPTLSPMMRDVIAMIQAHARHSFVLVHSPSKGARLAIETPHLLTMTFSSEHEGEVWLMMDTELTPAQAAAVVETINGSSKTK